MVTDALTDALRAALTSLGLDAPEEIHLERPGKREHGDWSSNVALATAKKAGRNPRELAQQLADHLNAELPPHEMLINLTRRTPAGFERCRRVCEIISTDEDDAAAGRKRYVAYKQQSYPLTHFVAGKS